MQILSRGTPDDTYQLASTTEAEMLRGANLCAWGKSGRWELLSFQNAALHSGTDTYNLSTFRRGLHGTEGNMSNHQSDDYFILLRDADGEDVGVPYLPLDLTLLNRTFNLKPVTANQDIGDATAQSFTWEGLSRKPLGPIIEPGQRGSNNDLLIQLTPRTRVGGGAEKLTGRAHQRRDG